MAKVSERIDGWLGRASGIYGLWPLVPTGAVGVLSAYFSTGVEWINQFGAFGWLFAGLAGFLASSLGYALYARTRLWRIEATMRERAIGNSSPFDPMATVYQNKRLYIRDLAPAGRNFVAGKNFINCEIIGPGTAKLMTRSNESKPWPSLSNNLMHDVDCIEVDPSCGPQNAIFFPDCNFHDCHFFNLTLMFDIRADGPGWNWITRDTRQPILTDQSTGGENA